jgi:hypothetical protein
MIAPDMLHAFDLVIGHTRSAQSSPVCHKLLSQVGLDIAPVKGMPVLV